MPDPFGDFDWGSMWGNPSGSPVSGWTPSYDEGGGLLGDGIWDDPNILDVVGIGPQAVPPDSGWTIPQDPFAFPGQLPSKGKYSLVPKYFTQPAAGMPTLSPMAMAYLSKIFAPVYQEGLLTKAYTTVAPEKEVLGPGGEVLQPGVTEEFGQTAAVTPKHMSAQGWGRFQGTGGGPSFESYLDLLGEGVKESYIQEMRAMWPSATKKRPTTWMPPVQR